MANHSSNRDRGSPTILIQAMAARGTIGASLEEESGPYDFSGPDLEATIMVDETACVRFWNGDAERMLGYSPEETVGKLTVPFFFLQEPFRTLFLLELDAGRLDSDSVHTGKAIEVLGRRKDGVTLPLEACLSIEKNNDRSLIAFTARLSPK